MDDLRISLLRDESKHQREMISSLRDQLYELRREVRDNKYKDTMRRHEYVIYGSFAIGSILIFALLCILT